MCRCRQDGRGQEEAKNPATHLLLCELALFESLLVVQKYRWSRLSVEVDLGLLFYEVTNPSFTGETGKT
jgi:hypothetical protein